MKRHTLTIFLNKVITGSAFLLLFSPTSCATQNNISLNTTHMKNHEKYPRIDHYYQIDIGNANAGSNTWTDSMGKKVYGGAADYRPHILCETFLLNEAQERELLKSALHSYVYFEKQAGENIILKDYFDALASPDISDWLKYYLKI